MKITHEEFLTPGEVAQIFRVDPKTVARWARAGMFTTIRTPGGHRRFSALEVYRVRDASRQKRRTS